ncbi:formin-like protein 3 [Rhodamnia argentea]|uniref:Formin-like protein 3 n=1 Tax=Rhodamnia argentea TaxID=178133 RepID=A0ABM3HCM5_9MYRT|nr:formin-like protein 3 [Rhodamnia argentea]
MDSGNSSASSQSSGGGDDEPYPSRADISSLFNAAAALFRPPPPPPPPTPSLHHQQLMFDPSSVLSNYFDPLTRSAPPASPLLNLDAAWPRSPRPDPSCTDLGLPSQQSPFLGFGRGPPPGGGVAPVQFPLAQEGSKPVQGQATASSAADDGNNAGNANAPPARNPKKRSRASRRAPTTVLTTDTTNFRAMVQEFTGIPAPPFAASPFQRSRLDLFGTTLRSGHLDTSSSPPPPYLLRPFAQRFHHPPPTSSSTPSFLGPSAMLDALASSSPAATTSNTNTTNNENVPSGNTSATTNTSTATNAAPPLPFGLLKHPQNLLINMNAQNPILDFGNSLFQASLKYPNLPGPSAIDGAAADHHPHSNLRIGALEDFVRPPSAETENNDTTAAATNWNDRGAGDGGNHHQGLLSSLGGGITGNYGDDEDHPRRATNGRVFTYSGSDNNPSAPDRFHGDRGPEAAAIGARSEGMVESWICSSD